MIEDAVRVLPDGRVLIDYGPVTMVVLAERGGAPDVELCRSAFAVVDDELRSLSGALDMLRRYPKEVDPRELRGTARVMADAVLATGDPMLTPMAAVAGAMADAAADHLFANGAERAVANNGGDVAIRLREGTSINVGVCTDLASGAVARTVRLTAAHGIGGVATSGLGGRSLTTGIASGVTVFARRCADADALATLLADRSFIDVPTVVRERAGAVDPDSDIADQLVVLSVGELADDERRRALGQVMREARAQHERGGMAACIATVQGMTDVFDPDGLLEIKKIF